jgi:hypothetical protein
MTTRKSHYFHAWGKNHVTGLERELAVPQLMGEADQPLIGMPLLRSIKIGHPQGRAMAVQYARDDIRSAAMPYNRNDNILILKHSVPACFTVNTTADFIRINHARFA